MFKIKNQITLLTLIITFVLFFSYDAFSQTMSDDLKLSLETVPVEKDGSPLSNKPKIQVIIKNVTERTVYFSNLKLFLQLRGKTVVLRDSKPHLQLSDVPDNNCVERRCFFASAPLNVKKIKRMELIKVEVELDSIHWYSGGLVSYYGYSRTKNLSSEVGSGEFHILASLDVKPNNRKQKYESKIAKSDNLNIIL